MSIVINRVYTRGGDRGTTRLAGGQELPKDSSRIEAYGTVDELNAVLGVCAARAAEDANDEALTEAERETRARLVRKLQRIQNELFDLGGELATLPEDLHPQQLLVTDADVTRLEKEMDEANAHLEPLRSFVLPGGSMLNALLHQARTVCRRSERRLVGLMDGEPQRPETLRYVNRLSDWLFVMSRRFTTEEVLWKPGERE